LGIVGFPFRTMMNAKRNRCPAKQVFRCGRGLLGQAMD
jgi:hypothetical protein